MQFDASGNVGIGYTGSTSFTNKLDVNGSIKCTALYQTSDRALKKDIAPLGETLEKIMELKPATYRFKTESDRAPEHVGLIAQDVQQVFPDAVEQTSGRLALDYTDLSVASIKALQELKREKDSEIASLKTENAELKARLEKIETLLGEQKVGGR